MHRRAISIALAALLATHCGPAVYYGRRVLPPMPHNDAERCYEQKRLEPVEGHAEWWTPVYGGYHYVVYGGVVRPGLTFFRGDERLKPLDALSILPDPRLAPSYAARLDDLHGAAVVHRWSEPIAGILTVGGAGLMTAGLIARHNDDFYGDGNRGARNVAYIGAGMMIASLIPWTIAIVTQRQAREYGVLEQLFVAPDLEPEVRIATDTYNRGVFEQCGLGPAPAPEQPSAPNTPDGSNAPAAAPPAPAAPAAPKNEPPADGIPQPPPPPPPHPAPPHPAG